MSKRKKKSDDLPPALLALLAERIKEAELHPERLIRFTSWPPTPEEFEAANKKAEMFLNHDR